MSVGKVIGIVAILAAVVLVGGYYLGLFSPLQAPQRDAKLQATQQTATNAACRCVYEMDGFKDRAEGAIR